MHDLGLRKEPFDRLGQKQLDRGQPCDHAIFMSDTPQEAPHRELMCVLALRWGASVWVSIFTVGSSTCGLVHQDSIHRVHV